eukprot:gb/GFBE01013909.1/.p2 GENE.gb/GFBE01013909.1/~~gb/GFBE01013909.1/.p2  ORF type:complete len:122 (-),score=28.68 gb/GFBE01013909.1/:12-377(-)
MTRRSGVLQVLSEQHAELTHLLGGQSGFNFDKAEGCRARGFEWCSESGFEEKLLPGCLAYLKLSLQGEVIDAGDHDVAICKLDGIYYPKSQTESNSDLLLTDLLRDRGLISAAGRAIEPAR